MNKTLESAIADSRQIGVTGALFIFENEHPGLWCSGQILMELMNRALLRCAAFANANDFRLFMAQMVDAGLLRERSGQTMIAPRLEDLYFATTNWIQILLKSASRGELYSAGMESTR